MGIFNLFRRNKVDNEAARRTQLLRLGRITEGTIFDVTSDDSGLITHIFFSYNLNGVDYEASQSLDDEQRARQADYIPGARITVRYNPRQPGNSVVV
jgi:hypothetical protein